MESPTSSTFLAEVNSAGWVQPQAVPAQSGAGGASGSERAPVARARTAGSDPILVVVLTAVVQLRQPGADGHGAGGLVRPRWCLIRLR